MSDLGAPPEFGTAGENPPSTGRSHIVSTSYFVVPDVSERAMDLLRFPSLSGYDFSRDPEFSGAAAWLADPANTRAILDAGLAAIMRASITTALSEWRNVELRRLTYSQRWIRDDRIIQVACGATIENTVSRTVGISATQATELSAALGIKTPGHVNLSAELRKQISSSITVGEQRTDSETISLTNDRKKYNRRFALWRVGHILTVHRLAQRDERSLIWMDYITREFFASARTEGTTSKDVRVQS